MRVSLRPDPSKGVFETMLVLAGRPVELDAHVERLATSVATLYAGALPSEARGAVLDRATEIELGKLRLTVVPADSGMELRIAASEIDPASVFPGPEGGAGLRSFVVTGGLGDHKWADRRLLDRAAAAAPVEVLPLLLDGDGSVLEASRASVFAIREGRLATPPSDGRILPSIARAQVIEIAAGNGIEVHEERLALADLRASEVFLVGSVRGVEPARSLDGEALGPPGELSGRLADGLRRRWSGMPVGEPVAAGAGGRPGGRPGR